MKNKFLVVALAVMFLFALGGIGASSTRVNGNMHLTWTNAYNRPQAFAGTPTGGLAGSITLTTNTYYDTTVATDKVGVTDSENVILTLTSGTICTGFYAGANVNAGRNSGTFTLACDNGNTVQGIMYGVNDNVGDIDASYDAFITTPEAPDSCTCDLTALNTLLDNMHGYPGFSDFWAWVNRECNNGDKQCAGDATQLCVNYKWVSKQTCQYGCNTADGKCNPRPKEDCTIKPDQYLCIGKKSYVKSFDDCEHGHGTATSCEVGFCDSNKSFKEYCSNGCDAITGKCKI